MVLDIQSTSLDTTALVSVAYGPIKLIGDDVPFEYAFIMNPHDVLS